MTAVVPVPGVEKLSASQLAALKAAADRLGIPVDWLATVISFETGGSFSPTVRNAAGSGAFGLIQFMPTTAQNMLKTATKDEAVQKGMAMSFSEQLDKMVVPYLAGRRYDKLEDVYLQIFYPVATNKPDDYVIGSSPSKVYTQNLGFDTEGKGYITKYDVTRKIRNLYAKAAGLPPIALPKANGLGQFIIGLLIAGGMTWAAWTRTDLLQGRFTLRKKPRPLPSVDEVKASLEASMEAAKTRMGV